jgi:hypothetical protein
LQVVNLTVVFGVLLPGYESLPRIIAVPHPYSNRIPNRGLRSGFSTECMYRTLRTSLRDLALLALLIACTPSHVHAQTMVGQEQDAAPDAKLQNGVEKLAKIQQSIELKRSATRDLKERLKQLEDSADRQELEQKIERIKNEIAGLQLSFEQIALGGVDLSILTDITQIIAPIPGTGASA